MLNPRQPTSDTLRRVVRKTKRDRQQRPKNRSQRKIKRRANKMGCLLAKPGTTNEVKYDKNHRKMKMFSFGVGLERGDLTINAHTQIGYVSPTVKKYGKINDENSDTVETNVDVSGVLPTHPDNG